MLQLQGVLNIGIYTTLDTTFWGHPVVKTSNVMFTFFQFDRSFEQYFDMFPQNLSDALRGVFISAGPSTHLGIISDFICHLVSPQ